MELKKALRLPLRGSGQALRLGSAETLRLAFVGAGGKTTAMFHLARELDEPVIIAATTHLAVEQVQLADQHFILQKIKDTNHLDDIALSGVILLTGPIEGNRTTGLSEEIMAWLDQFCGYHSLPMLIEADGSRQLPFKAPASHEPPIPEFVNTVVVVAGLSGLGKPINADWVHRPDRFADLSGLELGEQVTPEALVRVLIHPEGGMKNIPPKARRIALINQADSPEMQATAQSIAKIITSEFQSVIVSAFNVQALGLSKDEGFGRPNANIFAVYESIAGIVLAGGSAVRYGEPKQLLPWKGKPLVWHVAKKALTAGLSPVVVVGGAYTSQLGDALEDLSVEIIHNPDWTEGQSTSVKVGLGAVQTQVGGAIFLLADQPQVPETLIRSLVEAHTQGLFPIVAPLVQGQRANPVLFDRTTFPDFQNLTGDAGARKLFSMYPVKWVPWHDDLPILDVDTPEDYQKLLNLLK